jgi:hypothetical protein
MPELLSTPDVRSWQPTADAKTLAGQPIPAEMDFFVRPPDEIGPVVTAESLVKVGQTLLPLPLKLGVALLIAAIGIGVFMYVKHQTPPHTKPSTTAIVILMTSLVVPIFVVALAFKPTYLVYIGRDGAALYKTRGARSAVAAQVARYEDVAEIRLSRNQMKDGGTELQMHVLAATGRKLMSIRGIAAGLAGKQFKDERYRIAKGIADAWSKRTGKMPTMG